MPAWIAILRNPHSGAGRRRREILRLVRGLKDRGQRVRLFSSRERLADRLADPEQSASLRCLVAAGGDGTLHDVINRYPGVPITMLAQGTENLFGRVFGLPADGDRLAEVIQRGHTRKIDLGIANGYRFALMASVGFDAEVVRSLAASRRGRITKWTYLPHIWRTVRTYAHSPLRIELDDDDEPLTGSLVAVMNLPAYGFGLRVADAARDDDGLLDVRIFQKGSLWDLLGYVRRLRTGTHERLPHVISRAVRRIRISAEEPVPVQMDGDPGGHLPVEISVEPAALDIVVPGDENLLRGGIVPQTSDTRP